MAKPAKNPTILTIPRVYVAKKGKGLAPEVVRLYNTFREQVTHSPWGASFTPLPIGCHYPQWALLLQSCQAYDIDPDRYVRWIFAQGVLAHPRSFLPFALANGTLWRFQKAGKLSQARHRDFGDKLVDDRTGQTVDWIFDRSGQPLLTPPSEGEVYDEKGQPIPLRRFA